MKFLRYVFLNLAPLRENILFRFSSNVYASNAAFDRSASKRTQQYDYGASADRSSALRRRFVVQACENVLLRNPRDVRRPRGGLLCSHCLLRYWLCDRKAQPALFRDRFEADKSRMSPFFVPTSDVAPPRVTVGARILASMRNEHAVALVTDFSIVDLVKRKRSANANKKTAINLTPENSKKSGEELGRFLASNRRSK